MNIREVSGKAVLEAGWPKFAITHKLKIDYLMFFKKLTAKECRVVIFDYYCCEVVSRCPEHPRSMRGFWRRSGRPYLCLVMLVI
jgi:hypothetical protein